MADANLIDSNALARVQDIELVNQFEQGVAALLNVLDIAEPHVMSAGTQIQMYEITGTLQSGAVAEGEDIPLSKYQQVKGRTYTVDLEEYRKATTAQAILKFGYDAAVGKTDQKMVRDIQGGVRRKFFSFLAEGTGTASGATFQQAFAAAWGTLANTLSELDTDGTPVYFANPLDLAAYLGAAQINNVESAFSSRTSATSSDSAPASSTPRSRAAPSTPPRPRTSTATRSTSRSSRRRASPSRRATRPASSACTTRRSTRTAPRRPTPTRACCCSPKSRTSS